MTCGKLPGRRASRHPLLDEGAGLFGHELTGGAIQHFIQPIQQHQGASRGESLLKQRSQPGQAAPLVVVDGKEIAQGGGSRARTAQVVVESGQRHEDGQAAGWIIAWLASGPQRQVMQQGGFPRTRIAQDHHAGLTRLRQNLLDRTASATVFRST